MKVLKLNRLCIDHFKGQRHLVLDFGGRSASIYGDNAAGKTTVYDALTWLLFGKDSRGQGSFDIKPLDTDGAVEDHAAVTTVEAALLSGSAEVTLKKTYYEKWSTKRGSAAETYDGNTSDYYIDGVPCKKYEFERRVAELVEEDVFRLLTSVTYFCSSLDWRERRRVLFEVGGVAPDGEIMAKETRFAPLKEAAGRLTLDDYKKKLQAERKGLSGVREDVPVRLDECRKTVEELEGIDYAALQRERDGRAKKRDALASELLKLDHSALLDAKRNERDSVKNRLAALENENAAYRRQQIAPPADDGSGLRREKESVERNIVRWKDEKTAADREIALCDDEVEACRARWKEVNARKFGGATCPTCGQELPEKLLAAARERFEAEKSAELRDTVAGSERFKGRAEEAQKRRDALIGEIAAAENRVAELAALLAAVKPVKQPPILDMPDYRERKESLTSKLEALERDVSRMVEDSTAIRGEIEGRIEALRDEISAIDATLAKRDVLEYTRGRMDALRADAQAAAERLEAIDRMLFLCDEFTRYKAGFIEEGVNSRFSMVRFRLFAEQVNGGLAECCDAMVDGVPYQSLNNGARINAGLDVIAALSDHYGAKVPLIIDNAESVTALRDTGTQTVRLVVSAADKELRCEYEN